MKKRISMILACILLVTAFGGCGIAAGRQKTIFIYMCGSNLETKQGLAGKNIDELLTAKVGDNLHIVIQTGGAQTWRSHNIDHNAIQRYEIKNGELKLLETLPQANMGEAATLTDFLTWGRKEYNSKSTMLILWDHGGGMDYQAICKAFAGDSESKEIGVRICDAFLYG